MTEKDHCLTKLSICLFLSVCLSCLSVTQGATSVCPDFDLDGDCRVDFNDFAIFVTQWLAQRIDCNSGYEDCDDYYYNGCETHVAADANNCGGCGIICNNLPNASMECIDGNCVIGECVAGYGDCDGIPGNGCERNLMTDPDNCGFCGNACDFHNAIAECQSGSCVMTGCDPGYANCDEITGNGCEVDLNSDPACTAYDYIGQVYGDEGCTPGPSRSSRGEKWYGLLVLDGSSYLFNSTLYLRVALQSPSGTDYGLYLYDNCGSGPIASSHSGGTLDQIDYSWTDNVGSDDSRFFYIEVRYFSGSSCSNWDLNTWGDCKP